MDERLEKITDLDKRVERNDLIYRYKGKLANIKFDEFELFTISIERNY